jgi:hypothetical protein
MRHRDYNKQVKVWTAQYMDDPTPEQAIKFNPTAFKLRVCSKCKKTRHLQRHHKGHEFLFANILPHRYAKRYCEFREEDIDRLCKRCHKNEGAYMKNTVALVIAEYQLNKSMSFERCEYWRKKIITTYNKWIKKPIRRRNVSPNDEPL